MYLICVDFSENNLLTEQLNVRSFYDLPVLNNSLLNVQLTLFSEVDITKAYIENNERAVDFSAFKTQNIKLDFCNKHLSELNGTETIILFRNDVYFEDDITKYVKNELYNNILSFCDNRGFCVCVLISVNCLRKLINRNIGLKDLFLNYQKYSDINMTLDGYILFLHSVNSYKNFLFDILNDKLLIKPPRIAEGVFVNSVVPKGDFSIVPPVYLGDLVQIESGSVVGPNTVIYNNSLISTDTILKNSILLDSVFVSSNCYVDGAVCCENSSIKRNSAVFSGSVIGENALIGENMLVEVNSKIKKNVKFDKLINSPFKNNLIVDYENKFQGLTPDKASFLGAAIATVFKRPKVIIASDGSANSLAIKLALLSGLIASGAECYDIGATFKAQLFFNLLYCECSFSIFVSGKANGTDIEIFDCENEALSKVDCCNLIDFCNNKDFVYVGAEDCRPVRQIRGMKNMYIRELTSIFNSDFKGDLTVKCNNPLIFKCVEDVLNRVVNTEEAKACIYVTINDSATKVSINYEDITYSEKILKKLVHFYIKKEEIFYRFPNIYYQQLYKKDALFLLMSVLFIIDRTKKDIAELINELPDFFVCSKSFECSLKAGELAKKIASIEKCRLKNGSFSIPLKNGTIKLSKSDKQDKIKIFCASNNLSFSRELCDILGGFIASSDA